MQHLYYICSVSLQPGMVNILCGANALDESDVSILLSKLTVSVLISQHAPVCTH